MSTTHSNEKPVRIPGPDHPITIERHPSRIVVKAGGKVIADTREALTLREARYPAVAPIREHLAFYPDRIDAIEELPVDAISA
jgi:uncharacterized protein (DUF427 family)